MLDLYNLVTDDGSVQVFMGRGGAVAAEWNVWNKPRGKSMVNIFMVGKGGDGGTGVVGAASTAAGGGGGGGSGGQVSLTMPLALLPDELFLSLAGWGAATAAASYITIAPTTGVNNVLVLANGGGNGGNASGATAGIAGTAGAISTAGGMPLGWSFVSLALAGQAGLAGGTTGAATALSIPTTGLLVTGGTGGAGLGAAASAGTAGGAITGSGQFATHSYTNAASAATIPPTPGPAGIQPVPKTLFLYGGLGGGSTNGSASGAGLVQAAGGHGMPGCGGGGSGGALTGSAAGVVGRGGPAFAIITCW